MISVYYKLTRFAA